MRRASRSTARRCRSTTTSSISGMGMAVTVEIKTGERSVLSYLLSPILQLQARDDARALSVSTSPTQPGLAPVR